MIFWAPFFVLVIIAIGDFGEPWPATTNGTAGSAREEAIANFLVKVNVSDLNAAVSKSSIVSVGASVDTVSISIASPKNSTREIWPVYNYNLVQNEVEHGTSGALGESFANGPEGAVAVSHALATTKSGGAGIAFAQSKAIAISRKSKVNQHSAAH